MKYVLVALFIGVLSSENYFKNYFENGQIKSEGWLEHNKKTKYWHFYYNNGNLKSKGHYNNNLKTGYWYYYNDENTVTSEGYYTKNEKNGWWKNYKGDTIEEVEYINSKKEGLSIYKVKGKPVKAEYYKNGNKTHEWFTLARFKKEYFKIDE